MDVLCDTKEVLTLIGIYSILGFIGGLSGIIVARAFEGGKCNEDEHLETPPTSKDEDESEDDLSRDNCSEPIIPIYKSADVDYYDNLYKGIRLEDLFNIVDDTKLIIAMNGENAIVNIRPMDNIIFLMVDEDDDKQLIVRNVYDAFSL